MRWKVRKNSKLLKTPHAVVSEPLSAADELPRLSTTEMQDASTDAQSDDDEEVILRPENLGKRRVVERAGVVLRR